MKILDVGCGYAKTPGAIGIDQNPRSNADVIHDLEKYPWPFGDAEFDEIICNHIIEHVADIVRFLAELHRVAKPGGIVKGATPHFSNRFSYTDPTHRHHLAWHFPDYFTGYCPQPLGRVTVRLNKALEFDFFGWGNTDLGVKARFENLHRELSFPPIFCWLGIAALANKYPDIYEHFFTWLFPARDIYFRLKVIKN